MPLAPSAAARSTPQVEHADSLTGFLLLQSMAGGTGAGLGTYVAEALRDEYHSAFVANCCVWWVRVCGLRWAAEEGV